MVISCKPVSWTRAGTFHLCRLLLGFLENLCVVVCMHILYFQEVSACAGGRGMTAIFPSVCFVSKIITLIFRNVILIFYSKIIFDFVILWGNIII
jgi:hypothetical protein